MLHFRQGDTASSVLRLGLDEAALGPRLGPFCAGLTAFHVNNTVNDELYPALGQLICQKPENSARIVIADSKKIYSPATGAATLENTVLTSLVAAGFPIPKTFLEFLSILCDASDISQALGSPWFAPASQLMLPWSEISPVGEERSRTRTRISETGFRLAENLSGFGVRILPPSLRFISASSFNAAIEEFGGKAGAVQSILQPLMAKAMNPGRSEALPDEPVRLIVDRQGGRRYYGEWLTRILPGAPLRAIQESSARSSYECGNARVEFLVGADDLFMETALASMFAKYARESAMRLFNQWWCARLPGLRPTAGYPQDAARFIADITEAGLLPTDTRDLIRSR